MKRPLLVNKQNILPKSYIPEELVQEPNTGIWLTKEVFQAFSRMNHAVANQGLSGLILVSGYRSYDYQQKIFDRKVNNLIKEGLMYKEAMEKAKKVVAMPGTSEHQTGLAIDLTNCDLGKEEDPLIEGFAATAHGIWLEENAHNHGFVLRYPKDKVSITQIIYEPWHYRYVGYYHAEKIKELNICLEEYTLYLNTNNI